MPVAMISPSHGAERVSAHVHYVYNIAKNGYSQADPQFAATFGTRFHRFPVPTSPNSGRRSRRVSDKHILTTCTNDTNLI
jgi:hypothetical protein